MTHKNPMELDDYLGQDWRENTTQPTMSVDDFLNVIYSYDSEDCTITELSLVVENLIDNFNHTDFLNEIILKIDLKRSAPVCSIGMLRMTKVLKLSNWNDYFDRCFENFSSRNLKDIDGIFQGLTKV